ncbi:MAG: hypothetical protein NTZ26_01270 [Candidatus Aminicenantes bacterium]|nr:hypothetical protein [Candidatus Aminicenantes bacterium]
MSKLPSSLRLPVFALFSILVAGVLQLRQAASSYRFSAHALKVAPGLLAVSAAVIFVFLLGLWALASHFMARATGFPYKQAIDLDVGTWAPLLFLALTPMALRHYTTHQDLAARLGLWLTVVFMAVLYLKIVRWREVAPDHPPRWQGAWAKFLALDVKRKLPLLFLTALLVTNGASVILSSKGITFSGDEPHYIINTVSLLRDGDLDLANNYAEADYHEFTPDNVVIRPHALAGRKPGGQYSFHSPGVSFYLLPFYALGRGLSESALVLLLRFAMTLLGGLFGLQIYLYARREWGRERLALGLWALASFTTPVFFFSLHVYPEIVVALFSITVFRLFRFSERLTTAKLLLCGFLLPAFVWFHALKYIFILIPLFLYCVWTLVRRKTPLRDWAAFLVIPAVLAALYLWFSYKLYGSLNPTSVSWQGPMDGRQTLGFLKMLWSGIPFRYRLETLAGYFFDQRDGLLLYAPVYFFAFLGFFKMARKKSKQAWLILAIAAPYALVSAFLTQRTGYAPQARTLVAAIWAPILFLGAYLASERKRIFAGLFNAAAGLSLLITWLLLQNPLALYQETTQGATDRGGDLFYILSNLHLSLPKILPSFLKVEDWHWTPNFVWPAITAAFIAVFLLARKKAKRLPFAGHLGITAIVLALFFVWFTAVPRLVLFAPAPAALPGGPTWTFYNLSRVAHMHQPARFSLLEDGRDYDFYFASPTRLDKLRIDFGSGQGDYELRLGFWDDKAETYITKHALDMRVFEAPPAYRRGGEYVYRVSIGIKNLSGAKTIDFPYQFALSPI